MTTFIQSLFQYQWKTSLFFFFQFNEQHQCLPFNQKCDLKLDGSHQKAHFQTIFLLEVMNILPQIIVTAAEGKPASQIRHLRNKTQPNKMVVSFVKQEKGDKKASMSLMRGGEKKPSFELSTTGEKSHILQLKFPYFFVTSIFVSKSF